MAISTNSLQYVSKSLSMVASSFGICASNHSECIERIKCRNSFPNSDVVTVLQNGEKGSIFPSLNLHYSIIKMSKILPAGIDFGNLKTLMEIFQINEKNPETSQLVNVVDRNGSKMPPYAIDATTVLII